MKLSSHKDAQYLFNDYSSFKYCCGFCEPSIQVVYEYNTVLLLKARAASRTLKRPYSCTVQEKEQESQLASCKILEESNFRG